jgi:hypothetical protein
MADVRRCDQCGSVFAPRREHARFCSARCRVAWNRARRDDRRPVEPVTEGSALQWSVTAMNDIVAQLPGLSASDQRACDPPTALAVIGEIVWQLTIVDATMVRYHSDVYDGLLAGEPAAERRLLEGTMSGLRFVRNHLRGAADRAAFAGPAAGDEQAPVTAWTWRPVPEPALPALGPRGKAWELTRYGDYQEFLVGHPVGETFGRGAAFLSLAAEHLPAPDGASAPAPR